MPKERDIAEFLEALGSREPTPGGGAAAALCGALAAALTEMVAQLTVGKPKFSDIDTGMRGVIERAQVIRAELLALMDEDAAAYSGVAAAYRLPKETVEEQAARTQAVQAALQEAMRPPMRIMRLGCDVLELAAQAASGNPSVVSDAGCAALIGEAAVRAGALNVLANVALLTDETEAEFARQTVAEMEEWAESQREHTMAAVHARMGIAH